MKSIFLLLLFVFGDTTLVSVQGTLRCAGGQTSWSHISPVLTAMLSFHPLCPLLLDGFYVS